MHASTLHIVEVKQAPGTQQYFVFQPNQTVHRHIPLGLRTQENLHSLPVFIPDLEVGRLFFFWFWQLYAKRCRIFLGPVVNKFTARNPVDGSVF